MDKMNMSKERDRIMQTANLKSLTRELNATDMLTVYKFVTSDSHYHSSFCALIPSANVEQSLSDKGWDLSIGDGVPGACIYGFGEDEQVTYHRFGSSEGIEPLVIKRHFHGLREDYFEIAEEFRLFHNLFYDPKANSYLKFDDDGNETVVITLEKHRIQIRVKEIRQFLAIKEMHLAIQFDYREHSPILLHELQLPAEEGDKREDLACWGVVYGDFAGFNGMNAFSRLLGKNLIRPYPKSKSGFWGFASETEEQFEDFIIDTDEFGEHVLHTSDPDLLSNNFGANPGAPNYLTPVCFRKEVLDKYYREPSKYDVGASSLSCAGLWSMYVDNHDDTKVYAWLGDLGRDLPHSEQKRWRSFNIPPKGAISETYFRQQILAEFTDSKREEDKLRKAYYDLQKLSEQQIGWPILLPLNTDDEDHLKCLRIPATDEQIDFDNTVLALSKILVDSLNQKKLQRLLVSDAAENPKGSISILERVFENSGAKDYSIHISFLRKLQNLRSTGAAHRKGQKYRKAIQEFRIEQNNLRSVIATVIKNATDCLLYMSQALIEGNFQIDEE